MQLVFGGLSPALRRGWPAGAGLLLCAALGAGAARAESSHVPAAGNAALLAGPCATCHGPDGHSAGSIPPTFGRSADNLSQILLLYKSGQLTGTVMNRITAGYSEEQLRAIAAHLATVQGRN